jgi:phage protein D/phage baseplate assembly protein gpV
VTAQAIAAVAVTVDGRAVAGGVRVLSARVARRFGMPGQCELAVHDPAGYAGFPEPFRLGASLRVAVVGEDVPLFEGDVTCVELVRSGDGTTTVRVRGYDVLHRLRKRQTLRVFENVTAADVARVLTGGLGVRVDGGDGPALVRVVQHRQNDFELLVEVAARTGHLIVLDGDRLRLTTIDGTGEPIGLRCGSTLHEASVEVNTDRVAGSVAAYGWDAQTATQLRATAHSGRSSVRDRLGLPTGADVSLLEQRGYAADDVTALARMAIDVRAASGAVLRGMADGDPRLRPGARVDLTGLGEPLDGRYVLTDVTHRVDADGFRTLVSTEPPATAAGSGGATITLGVVTAVDDPLGRGRVRVTLPALGDIDAGWLGVVCPGAGRGKGLVALPDVDDTVAIALPHADPTAGLVLGSLYGGTVPPDTGVTGGSVRRWSLRTADGQSIVIDDDEHSIRLANKDGSFVSIAPEALELHARTDLVLDAAGHAITIRGRSVDFEHALI